MKSWLAGLVFGVFLLVPLSAAHAVYVHGYYRSNGTYVQGYERTSPDGNPYNNYSYPGNYNPNTGKITGGDPVTYLNNYYKNSSSGSSGYSSLDSLFSSPSYSSYTPTCPLFSYYNGSSCTCSYGYVASGGSCVSRDSLCHAQTGYSSSYDSLTDTCKCDYGYVIGSDGKCTNANLYCETKMGLMSEYDSLSKTCKCMSGYEFNGSTCEYKSPYSAYSAAAAAAALVSCPANSHESPTDSTSCVCDTGYQVNSTKTGCELVSPNTLTCRANYGVNSVWSGKKTSSGLLICGCASGYAWNSANTECVLQ